MNVAQATTSERAIIDDCFGLFKVHGSFRILRELDIGVPDDVLWRNGSFETNASPAWRAEWQIRANVLDLFDTRDSGKADALIRRAHGFEYSGDGEP